MYHGILNVYKESGFTSHDVVAKLRGITRQKKIGHTGTLDPDATGVLPVCFGKATKVCDVLTDKSKTYEAVLLLGITTDTQDMSGSILSDQDVDVKETDVEKCILSFLGEQKQIPPMYSALKVNGKKLYELARAGKTVEREPRTVHFYDIKILSMQLPRVTISVKCSKGTYIRTLCHDIGAKIGCGAAMESLVRTGVGDFLLKDALKFDEIELLAKSDTLYNRMIPIDQLFVKYPKVVVNETNDKPLHNGCKIELGDSLKDDIIRIYDSEGVFVALYQSDPTQQGYFKPKKMFYLKKEETNESNHGHC